MFRIAPRQRGFAHGGNFGFRTLKRIGVSRAVIKERLMFENLSERLSGVFDRLTKQGAL